MMIFITLTFGYGAAGFMIYGSNLPQFESFLRGALEMIVITVGATKYDVMEAISPSLTPYFVFSYLVIFV